jgi:hypothetical protein
MLDRASRLGLTQGWLAWPPESWGGSVRWATLGEVSGPAKLPNRDQAVVNTATESTS